jgi:hypothetical protein
MGYFPVAAFTIATIPDRRASDSPSQASMMAASPESWGVFWGVFGRRLGALPDIVWHDAGLNARALMGLESLGLEGF